MTKGFHDQIVNFLRDEGCRRVEVGKGSLELHSSINNRTVTASRSKGRHTANEVLKPLGIGGKI